MPHAEVAGRLLHYLRRGEGEPLLLIMGMSGNHLHWGEAFLSHVERDHEAIVFDNRGMGRSDREEEPFSIADMADDAAGLLDALGIERAHVMGCSMGGMIAQEVASRHPERVRTLVLGCTYAGGEGSALTDQAVMQSLMEAFMSGDRERAIQTGYRFNVSPAYAEAHPETGEEMARIAAELPASLRMIMAQMQAIGGHDTSARLGSIEAPTLIVHGTEDQMLPVANARRIAELMPDARLEILEGVGHLFWWERPERSAELVRELTHGVAATGDRAGAQ